MYIYLYKLPVKNIYLIPISSEIIRKISFTMILISFSFVVMNSESKGNKLIKCDFFFIKMKSIISFGSGS